MNYPRPIGYWYSERQKSLPKPQYLVKLDWISNKDRSRLINYLKSGETYVRYGGWSFCRFCGISGRTIGDRDLTDGIWLWPEGLYHYIAEHDVMLPDDFLAHCRDKSWTIPPANACASVESAFEHAFHLGFDFSAWIEWASRASIKAEPDVRGYWSGT